LSSGYSHYSRSYRSPRPHSSYRTHLSRSCTPRAYSSHPSYSPRAYTSHSNSRSFHSPGSIKRDSRGRMKRSTEAKDAFRRERPCPSTGTGSGACPGYVIDHVRPLECGGADDPSNMQWQTIADGNASLRTRRNGPADRERGDTWDQSRDRLDKSLHRERQSEEGVNSESGTSFPSGKVLPHGQHRGRSVHDFHLWFRSRPAEAAVPTPAAHAHRRCLTPVSDSHRRIRQGVFRRSQTLSTPKNVWSYTLTVVIQSSPTWSYAGEMRGHIGQNGILASDTKC
jgi:hypothetical protein